MPHRDEKKMLVASSIWENVFMQAEAPIFFVSPDNTFLDVRQDVEDAQEHLTHEHAQPGVELLYFDGLARPLEARGDGRVRLVLADPVPDPWQVRVRVNEAISRRREWVGEQGDMIQLDRGPELSKAEVEGQLDAIAQPGYDGSFAAFALTLLQAFSPQGHRGSFLHNLFHP